MNKTELVTELATRLNATKTDVSRFLNELIDVVSVSIKKREPVAVSGFCTISVKERKARLGRHPQTGNQINIPKKNVVKIVPGNLLKDAVKED